MDSNDYGWSLNGLSRLFGHIYNEPLSAFGRMDARLKEGDREFIASGEKITEELQAALRRIQIASRRDS